jgi:hypothetical protein
LLVASPETVLVLEVFVVDALGKAEFDDETEVSF